MKILSPHSLRQTLAWLALAGGALLAAAQSPDRFVGAITAIAGNTLTVQADRGEMRQITVPAAAPLQHILLYQRNLENAEAIEFNDLAVGDRVLIKLDTNAPAGVWQALRVVAVKRTDLEIKQRREREAWQRGVEGLVKSVDAAHGVILLTSGAGEASRTVTVHTDKLTIFKRYAPASARYDAALPAPIDAIRVGDQLRARGVKNADGSEITAVEAVSGSFRNIAGTVISFDAATATLTVKDLATKKPVALHIAPDAQVRRLEEHMARLLAARLKGGSGKTHEHGEERDAPPSPPGMEPRERDPDGDAQFILSRAPAIQPGDLKKGEAVMLVATGDHAGVTAITLLAGAEPLLEAPTASQNLLSNWSIGSGSPGVAQ